MRDIRGDLKERLANISQRYAEEMSNYDESRAALETTHRHAIDGLARERVAVEQLFAIENAREGEIPLVLDKRHIATMMDFLIAKVCIHGPISKDELRTEASAAGYFEDGNGRSFHTTLLNIVRSGKVLQSADGRYEAPTPLSLFNQGEGTPLSNVM